MANISMTTEQLSTVLLSTEDGNNQAVLNSFSYAGTGTSTYSFGVMQWDVGTNHGNVQQFLRDNGFNDKQIAELSQHGGLSKAEVGKLDAQLQAIPQDKMSAFVDGQLSSSVGRIDDLVGSLQKTHPEVAKTIAGSPELQLALADYDNQFSISGIGQKSQPNSMMSYLEGNSVKLPGGELKAGDPITRTDIQNFINATKYGVENPDSVASREQRLTAALDKLNIEHTPAQQGGSAPARTGSHTLREGDHSPAVGNLQHQLNQLGNLPHGKLMEDSRFGNGTKEAVEAFQRAHNLTPDGVVGDKTRSAMDEALKQQQQQSPQSQTAPATSSPDAPAAPTANAAQLNDPAHPGYDLFKQAQTAVYQMDTQHGRVPDQGSDNLAGTLAVKSYENGMTGINRVMLSEDASRAWAVQGDMNSPFKQYADVGVAQGVNTSIAQSTANWNQAQSQRGVDPSTQQTQQQNQNQNQQQPQPQTASAQR